MKLYKTLFHVFGDRCFWSYERTCKFELSIIMLHDLHQLESLSPPETGASAWVPEWTLASDIWTIMQSWHWHLHHLAQCWCVPSGDWGTLERLRHVCGWWSVMGHNSRLLFPAGVVTLVISCWESRSASNPDDHNPACTSRAWSNQQDFIPRQICARFELCT